MLSLPPFLLPAFIISLHSQLPLLFFLLILSISQRSSYNLPLSWLIGLFCLPYQTHPSFSTVLLCLLFQQYYDEFSCTCLRFHSIFPLASYTTFWFLNYSFCLPAYFPSVPLIAPPLYVFYV